MDVHPPKNGMYRYWSIAIFGAILLQDELGNILTKRSIIDKKKKTFLGRWEKGHTMAIGETLPQGTTNDCHNTINQVSIFTCFHPNVGLAHTCCWSGNEALCACVCQPLESKILCKKRKDTSTSSTKNSELHRLCLKKFLWPNSRTAHPPAFWQHRNRSGAVPAHWD